MTKEELKQEAEQDAGNASGFDLSTSLMVTKNKTDAYRLGRFDGYLSGAEPREKRIAELEKKNRELEDRLCNVANYLLDSWCRNKDDYCPHLAKLEKENAELIQENEEMKKGLGCETCQIHLEYMRLNNRIADLEKENAKLKKENKVLAQNLEDTEILNKTYEKRFDDLEKENTELKKLKRECETSLCRAEYQYNYEQLAKAKDILRRLMKNQPTPSSMYEEADLVGWREVNKEAEQFLKDCEVEK